MGEVLRVNSKWENICPVGTWQAGVIITYQRDGSSTGTSISPMPSAQALWPATNTGTSAPSEAPSACRRAWSRPTRHRWLRASRVVAALELPPPRPPPLGICLSTVMVTPFEPCCSRLAARYTRLSRSGMSRPGQRTWISPLASLVNVKLSPQSSNWNRVCRSW